jgi:hypothetical protein
MPSHQLGFRSKHSAIHQVHRITNVIEKSLEQKQVCSAIFLDIAQALTEYGMTACYTNWNRFFLNSIYQLFKSYLNERKFHIKYEDEYSELKEIRSGVPQESVLGPVRTYQKHWIVRSLHLQVTPQLWLQETHSMNQQQNCNERLMISPPGHVNGASNSMKLNLHISVSPTKRLISDQFFLMALGYHLPIQQCTSEWHLMPSSNGRRTSRRNKRNCK